MIKGIRQRPRAPKVSGNTVPKDHFKLVKLRELDDALWLRYLKTCKERSLTPIRALEVLLALFIEDASFTEIPKQV
jgi:hypothetical protein